MLQREELDKGSIFLYFKMKKTIWKQWEGICQYIECSPSAYWQERNHNTNSLGPKFCEAKLVLEEKKSWSIFL